MKEFRQPLSSQIPLWVSSLLAFFFSSVFVVLGATRLAVTASAVGLEPAVHHFNSRGRSYPWRMNCVSHSPLLIHPQGPCFFGTGAG